MMKDLLITNCENEGNQAAILLKASITRETGCLAIEQFDRDAIELTREQALELTAYILKNYDKIATNSDFDIVPNKR